MFETVTKTLREAIESSAEASQDELRRICEGEGLDSADSIASFLSQIVEEANSRPEPDIFDLPRSRVGQGPGGEHRRPSEPFLLEGHLWDPEDIEQFEGRPLHTVATGGRHPAVFKTIHEAQMFIAGMQALQRAQEPKPCTCHEETEREDSSVATRPSEQYLRDWDPSRQPVWGCFHDHRPPSEAQFFEHAAYDGNWFWLAPGWGYRDLTRLLLSHAIFSSNRSWNDEMSSVKPGDGTVYLFEHVQYQGSTLLIPGGPPTFCYDAWNSYLNCTERWCSSSRWRIDQPRLSVFGWNDRVSSVGHATWHYAG
jgi:hypothetical protein